MMIRASGGSSRKPSSLHKANVEAAANESVPRRLTLSSISTFLVVGVVAPILVHVVSWNKFLSMNDISWIASWWGLVVLVTGSVFLLGLVWCVYCVARRSSCPSSSLSSSLAFFLCEEHPHNDNKKIERKKQEEYFHDKDSYLVNDTETSSRVPPVVDNNNNNNNNKKPSLVDKRSLFPMPRSSFPLKDTRDTKLPPAVATKYPVCCLPPIGFSGTDAVVPMSNIAHSTVVSTKSSSRWQQHQLNTQAGFGRARKDAMTEEFKRLANGETMLPGKRAPPPSTRETRKQPKFQQFPSVDVEPKACTKDTLDAIVEAQNGGLFYYPTYELALEEICHGAKQSCWMWYIWPSMQGVRMHRMPQLLLPSFQSAIEYLQHDLLRTRLVEITSAAEGVLSSGRSTTTRLFGGGLDSTKVHESCTVFALAALAAGFRENAHLFIRIIQIHYGGPNETVMEYVLENNGVHRLVAKLLRIADSYKTK